jgi:hypothetical protein
MDVFDHRRHLPRALPQVATSTPTMTWAFVSMLNWTL